LIETPFGSGITSLNFGVNNNQLCFTTPYRTKKDRSKVFTINIDDAIKYGKPKVMTKEKIEGTSIESIPHKVFSSDTDYKISIARFINNNKNILCAFDNGLVQLRKATGEIVKTAILHENSNPNGSSAILDLDISACEELCLSSSKDGRSVLFDPDTLEVLNVFKPENPQRNINSGKISPLFNPDLSEDKQLRHIFLGGGQDSNLVTFTRASEGGFDILLYDMISGDEIGAIGGHFSPINALAVSHNGKLVVSGGEEATVRMHILPAEYYQLKEF
jgi:WD40 repeat protein